MHASHGAAMFYNPVMTACVLTSWCVYKRGSEQITGLRRSVEVCANYECLGYNWYQPFCRSAVLIKVCSGSFIRAVSRNTSADEENNRNRTKEPF